MATSNSIRPPLKHTPFDTTAPDGRMLVSNEWYDWALSMKKAVDTLRVIVGDPDGDGIVEEEDGGMGTVTEDVASLLTAEVSVFAHAMRPTATGGCSALEVIEFGAGQPNFHVLLFDPIVSESADFAYTLPFSWVGRSYRIYIYWGHGDAATTFGVTWEVTANATSDGEVVIRDFVPGALISDTRVTAAGNLYITTLSGALPISSIQNLDGDLVNFRIYRRPDDSNDNLDVDAALIAVRFTLTDLPAVETDTCDPFWGDVSLLLEFEGANNSTVFTDSSSYANTVTPTGTVKLVAATRRIGISSAFFDGSTAYLSVPYGVHLNLASTDFTLEGFSRLDTSLAYQVLLDFRGTSGFSTGWSLYLGAIDRTINVYHGPTDTRYQSPENSIPVEGSWFHWAVTVSGTLLSFFIDGTLVYTAIYSPPATSATGIRVGANNDGSSPFEGNLDAIRITKGVVRYASNFIAPSSPFPSSSCGSGFDPVVNRATITYASSNTVVSKLDSTNFPHARSIKKHSTGKRYYVCVLTSESARDGLQAGFAPTSLALSAFPGSTAGSFSCQFNRIAGLGTWAAGSFSALTGTTCNVGDSAMLAIDFDAGKIWYGRNGTWYNGGDPAAGTGANQTFTANSVLHACFNDTYLATRTFFMSGSAPYAPPSGFTYWDL